MRVLIPLIIFFPTIISAQSIFSDDEDSSFRKEENSLLGSFFGSAQGGSQKESWGRFKPLEEYGQSPVPVTEERLPPDPSEIKAAQDYYNSKDPFSNSNRLEQVYENLNPEKK